MRPDIIHDMIDHVAKHSGIDHIGIGSDFDGFDLLLQQLEDVSTYPRITQELINRGYSDPGICKMLGENMMRLLGDAENVAWRL